jgi:hypothetical protein
MAVTVDTFTTDYPQFLATETETIERALSRAALRISAAQWGALYEEGQSLLAAHLLTIAAEATATDGKGQGVAGGVSSISVDGDISVSYADASYARSQQGSSNYDSTIYGRDFLQLQRQVIVPVRII